VSVMGLGKPAATRRFEGSLALQALVQGPVRLAAPASRSERTHRWRALADPALGDGLS